METDHFSLRFRSLTADLPVTADQQQSAVTAAQTTFENLRRDGVPLSQAIEVAVSVLLETITPMLDAASRLKDILEENFADVPALANPPHFPLLLQQLMPLLGEAQNRLADAYIIGLVTEYRDKNLSNGL